MNNIEATILQALRAGPLTCEQIVDRLDSVHSYISKSLSCLTWRGYIRISGKDSYSSIYAITDAGRAACPPRNPAAARRVVVHPRQGDAVSGPSAARGDHRRNNW